MLHVTGHFDACDIDKFNNSPISRTNAVYHAKKRFKAPHINMHYGKTFDAVGASSGDKTLDGMRFLTQNQAEHSIDKVKQGSSVNPTTVFETMAKQSRLKLNVSGKPRGLLAQEDFYAGYGADGLLERQKRSQTMLHQAIKSPTKLSALKDKLSTHSNILKDSEGRSTLETTQAEQVGSRYATQKKLRKLNIIDVYHNREIQSMQKKLLSQLKQSRAIKDKAPHTNYDFFQHPPKNSKDAQTGDQNSSMSWARQYRTKSLYSNELTQQKNEMSRTMLIAAADRSFIQDKGAAFTNPSLSIQPAKGMAAKMEAALQQYTDQGELGLFGSNPNVSQYKLTHNQAAITKRANSFGQGVPSFEEMKRNFNSLTMENYQDLVNAKPFLPNYRRSTYGRNGQFDAKKVLENASMAQKINDIDYGELERQNRLKYGIKKAANIWRHEMDDNRITGSQIRTTNYRTSMHDAIKEANNSFG